MLGDDLAVLVPDWRPSTLVLRANPELIEFLHKSFVLIFKALQGLFLLFLLLGDLLHKEGFVLHLLLLFLQELLAVLVVFDDDRLLG